MNKRYRAEPLGEEALNNIKPNERIVAVYPVAAEDAGNAARRRGAVYTFQLEVLIEIMDETPYRG